MKCISLVLPSGRNIEEQEDLFPTEGKIIIKNESDVPQSLKQAYNNKLMKSSSGEITWDWQKKGAGVFMVDSRKTKVFSGFVRGRTFTYKGMKLFPGKSRLDWMTLSLTLAEPFEKTRTGNILQSGRYLLSATGLVHNTDASIVEVDKKNTISCTSCAGGSPGKGPVLCEGILAELSFAGLGNRMKCFALDPDGNRVQEVPVQTNESGEAILKIDPEYKTIWYEVIVNPITSEL